MARYAIGIEYDGTSYHGWQRVAADVPTVQGVLEEALGKVAASPVQLVCAGRTDAGVHAACQVAHFDSDVRRSLRGWMLGVTSLLPPDIAVHWCRQVGDGFNARFSAIARRYRYRLLNRQVRPGFMHRHLAWELRPLDAQAMHVAAQQLLGERDFSAFRSAQCQAPHARRDLQRLDVHQVGDEIVFEVQANAFLHHMVRNLVGALLEIGRGERQEEWLAELLAHGDRTRAGVTAPAVGLVFTGPLYPATCNLPPEVSA